MKSLPRCANSTKLAVIVVALLLPRCGGNGDDDINPDASLDATMDAPVEDSGKDSSTDAAKDVANDALGDAGTDASDASTDGGTDGALDAAIDSGPDSGIDSGVVCGSKMGYGFVSSGDSGICGSGEDYSCGADKFQVECDCPSGTCGCEKNGIPTGSTSSYAGCPACTTSPAFSTVAAACGIPY